MQISAFYKGKKWRNTISHFRYVIFSQISDGRVYICIDRKINNVKKKSSVIYGKY